MAYDFTVTKEPIGLSTRYTIVETEVGASDEWSISDLPALYTITDFVSTLTTAGSATTVQPALGDTASFTATRATTAAAAAKVINPTDVRGEGPTLYGRSTPDNTADEITTVLVVRAGH